MVVGDECLILVEGGKEEVPLQAKNGEKWEQEGGQKKGETNKYEKGESAAVDRRESHPRSAPSAVSIQSSAAKCLLPSSDKRFLARFELLLTKEQVAYCNQVWASGQILNS